MGKKTPFQNHKTHEKGDQPGFIGEIEQHNFKESSQLSSAFKIIFFSHGLYWRGCVRANSTDHCMVGYFLKFNNIQD